MLLHKITANSDKTEWNYVSGKMRPADHCTRYTSSNINEVTNTVLNFLFFFFFTKRFGTHKKKHQKAPKVQKSTRSTKSARKHKKVLKTEKARKHNQAKAQNANKRTKIKNASKNHLRRKKSLIVFLCLRRKK